VVSERLYADVLCPHGVRLGQIRLPVDAIAVIIQPYIAHCADCATERNRPHCQHHDLPVDRTGRCPECYTAAAEYAEHDRDTLHLWRNR
jgi:hypothetical protein